MKEIQAALAERVVEPWVITTMKERFSRARMVSVHASNMGLYVPAPPMKELAAAIVETSLRDLAEGRLERTVLDHLPALALGSLLVKENDS